MTINDKTQLPLFAHSGPLAQLSCPLRARSGHSPIAPDISGQFLQYNPTLTKGLLNQQEVEAIHLVVSEVSGCDYCLAAHLPFAYLRYECLKSYL